jgi:hypothetical protein
LYLVAPVRYQIWLEHFLKVRDDDVLMFTGETGEIEVGDISSCLEETPGRVVVLYSTHETLDRDTRLAEWFRKEGQLVLGQSSTAVQIGLDKFRMKTFFDERGFSSPKWTTLGRRQVPGCAGALVVVKTRHGTASQGMRLAQLSECNLGRDEYCELYHDGVEYSVVVYRDQFGIAVLPPVWKGQTSRDLTPPWRRLRICPDPYMNLELERQMRVLSRKLADAMELCGHMEVEYLVRSNGELLVLEVNPRISGTMRMAAMAADLPFFSLPGNPTLRGDIKAALWSGEIPYTGDWFSNPESGVFATTRLSVAAKSLSGVRTKLGEYWFQEIDFPQK